MSTPTTCGCLAATQRLSRDDQTDDDGEFISHPLLSRPSIPSGPTSSSFFSSSQTPTPGRPGGSLVPNQPSSSSSSGSSPSTALLHGRALTTHWARLSTTCPNSALHLSSPTILRYMVSALRSITVKYEAHLWQMVFNATTASAQSLPGLSGAAGPGGGGHEAAPGTGVGAATAGHIGIYRLEQDETQILLQEALRTSIEELGGLLSEIQRQIVMIRAATVNFGSGGGAMSGWAGNRLFAAPSDLNLAHGEMDLDMIMNMSTQGGLVEEFQGPPPTDQEMNEINIRLYQCLRRLDFLENGEVGKDVRW